MYEIEDGEKKERELERLGELDERLGGIGGDYCNEGGYGQVDERVTMETEMPSGSRTQTQTGDEMV